VSDAVEMCGMPIPPQLWRDLRDDGLLVLP